MVAEVGGTENKVVQRNMFSYLVFGTPEVWKILSASHKRSEFQRASGAEKNLRVQPSSLHRLLFLDSRSSGQRISGVLGDVVRRLKSTEVADATPPGAARGRLDPQLPRLLVLLQVVS